MSVKTTSASNNHLEHADAALLSPTEISISMWLKMHVISGTQDILSKSGSSTDLSYTVRLPSTGLLEFRTSTNGTSTNTVGAATALIVNTLYHLAFTHSTTSKKIYILGTEDAEGAGPGALFDSTVGLFLGQRSDGGQNANCFFEDVRLYNRSLTTKEVRTIHVARGHDGIIEGGIARWTMDEGAPGSVIAGATVKDVWQNALHLTGINSPTWEEGFVSMRRRRAA